MRTVFRLLVLLLASAEGLTTHGAERSQMAEDFAWFSSLGYPDVKGLKFVRYVFSLYQKPGEKEVTLLWAGGWLLAEDDKTFTVQTLALQRKVESKSETSRWEPVDPGLYAEQQLEPSDRWSEVRLNEMDGLELPWPTHLFLLGWMDSRNGFDDAAAKLYTAALKSADYPLTPPGPGPHRSKRPPLHDMIERDLGQSVMRQIKRAFCDSKVTPKELRERLRALAKRLPHCDEIEFAASLEKMLSEEEAHPARTAEQIAALSPEEQAREWVFRLRDETVGRSALHGSLGDDAATGKSPMRHLMDLGDAAIPALIDALGDRRWTRALDLYSLDGGFFTPLQIDNAALATIEAIAGRQFSRSGSMGTASGENSDADAVRAAVRAWRDNHKAKGPLVELSEATTTGDYAGSQAGQKLRRDFPAQATGPILAGAAAAKSPEARSAFVRLAGTLKDDRVADFLLREVRDGDFIGVRAEAAYYLAKMGRLEGIPILAEAWKSSRPTPDFPERAGREKLIDALTTVDAPEGIRALADGLRTRSQLCRITVLEALQPEHHTVSAMNLGDFSGLHEAAPKLSAPTLAAIEDLLGWELEDDGFDGTTDEFTVDHGQVTLRDPRPCDLAAVNLAKRWPEKYAFDPKGSFANQDRQRVIMLNTFRAVKELQALPLRDPRAVVAPEDAGKIAEVIFAGGGLTAPKQVVALLQDAKGRAVEAAFFEEVRKTFLDAYDGRMPPDDAGFALFALRENDHTGITLVVSSLERARAEKPRKDREWQVEAAMTLDGHDSSDGTEDNLFGHRSEKAGEQRIKAMLDKLQRLAAEKPFELVIRFGTEGLRGDDAL